MIGGLKVFMDEIVVVVEVVCVYEFIMLFLNGYNIMVGGKNFKLFGG